MHCEKKTRWTLVLSFAMRMAWETIVCCSFGVDPPWILPVMVSFPDLYTCMVAFPFRLAGAINFQILYRPLFRSPIILRYSLFLFFLCGRWHGLHRPAMSQLFMMICSLENIVFPSSTVKKFKAVDQHVLVDDDYVEVLECNLINVSLYSRTRHFDWNLLPSQVNEQEYRAFDEKTLAHSWMIRGWDSNDNKTDWS